MEMRGFFTSISVDILIARKCWKEMDVARLFPAKKIRLTRDKILDHSKNEKDNSADRLSNILMILIHSMHALHYL